MRELAVEVSGSGARQTIYIPDLDLRAKVIGSRSAWWCAAFLVSHHGDRLEAVAYSVVGSPAAGGGVTLKVYSRGDMAVEFGDYERRVAVQNLALTLPAESVIRSIYRGLPRNRYTRAILDEMQCA